MNVGARPFINAAVVSVAAMAYGVWLQGCSSGSKASAPDTGAADAGGNADGALSDVVTRVTFELPPRIYSFDTQTWMIPPGNSVAAPCGSAATIADCCNPPAPAAPPDCATTPLVCEAGLCTVSINLTVAQDINLKSEVPALAGLDQPLLGDVSLKQLRFATINTLNVSLPPLQLFLSAGDILVPGAPGQALGTIPAIPAGASTSGDVSRAPAADLVFATYAREFGKPLTLTIFTTVSVPSGSPPPTGTLTLTISGQASATL